MRAELQDHDAGKNYNIGHCNVEDKEKNILNELIIIHVWILVNKAIPGTVRSNLLLCLLEQI